ncbi:capsid assembly scaffolding protein Gp46 family protein, partial [Clostridium botulinum]
VEKELKTFTEEEVNKQLQSETDKVRTEYSKKIKAMEEELKELKPKEKTQEQIELENRVQALEQKEKEIQAKELQLKISKTLSDNGLPSQLSRYINLQGVEDVESYLVEVKNVLTEHINNSALNNSFKPQKHNSNKTSITKEDFNKMSYMERMNLYKENKELYNKLSK